MHADRNGDLFCGCMLLNDRAMKKYLQYRIHGKKDICILFLHLFPWELLQAVSVMD